MNQMENLPLLHQKVVKFLIIMALFLTGEGFLLVTVPFIADCRLLLIVTNLKLRFRPHYISIIDLALNLCLRKKILIL